MARIRTRTGGSLPASAFASASAFAPAPAFASVRFSEVRAPRTAWPSAAVP
ncbi:hypothetical protein [Streptomyces sp. NPDC058335]|uniref:hypothetical protein n=1 Tax=Streptomyces sp. NPDC058335 TaxID=3346451 RepID=UPI0036564418